MGNQDRKFLPQRMPISIIATALLPDYTNKDISTEAHYEEPL